MSHSGAIANMNSMGGSMGNAAPIPMMNNGTMAPQPSGVGASAPVAAVRPVPTADRSQLNKYIYDYFLQNHMWDCARALLSADNTVGTKTENGKNSATHSNSASDDAMDTDSKDDIDQKPPEDLPAAAIGNAAASDSAFLYDWFCLFWDMYHAQRHKNGNGSIHQYVSHTQTQSRLKQTQQHDMLRQMRPEGGHPLGSQHAYQMQHIQAMRMNNGPHAINMKQGGNLARTAMANNQNPQQAMQMMQAKHGQRDTAELEAMRPRASSPGSENAASPSKRPRLEGAPFNPAHTNMVPNGRPGQGMPGQPGAMGNPNPAHAHALMAAGISPQNIPPAHLQNFANTSQGGQAKSIQSYSQHLQQHHGSQMPNKSMPNTAPPPTQGSPGMMSQAPEINAYYNAATMDVSGRMGATGPGGVQQGGNNHALQDYQMQLMLLEQQNKKRLLMARQEQDNIGPMGRDGSGGPTPGPPAGSNSTATNGQFSDAASQVVRPGASPNSTDQMKRGTPQMNNANMPSPLTDSAQSRGSPNSIPFNINGPMDPGAQQTQQQFNMMQMANGMRPPGSHPTQSLNGAMTPQQQMMARQQQPQQPQPGSQQHAGQPPSAVGPNGPQGQWPQGQGQGQNQGGPTGVQMTPQQASQNQIQGTPQPRSMAPPPPSAAGAANTSPALSNRPPTPKPKRRDGESKGGKNPKGSHIQKKATATVPTRSTGEGAGESEATPATPITPANPGPFPKAGTGPNVVSASVSGQNGPDGATVPGVASAVSVAPQHSDPSQGGPSFGMDNAGPLPVEFPVDFGNGLSSGHMMEDFDFESFLHDDNGESNTFDFNATFTNLEGNGEIGAAE